MKNLVLIHSIVLLQVVCSENTATSFLDIFSGNSEKTNETTSEDQDDINPEIFRVTKSRQSRVGECTQVCPVNTVQVSDQYCYRYSATGKNWVQAKADCEAQGGYLAHPDATYNKTTNELGSVYRSIINKGNVWIGMSEDVSCIDWRWTDGTDSRDDPNWLSGQPGTTTYPSPYYCGIVQIFKLDTPLSYTRYRCVYSLPYLCQFDPIGLE